MSTLTNNKNFLQPSGFKIVINRKNFPNLEYFCQAVMHPGASVTPLEVSGRRITSIPLAGDKITYGELSLDIILDEDMQSYREMQDWLDRMVNEGQVSGAAYTGSVTEQLAGGSGVGKIPTHADITLSILSSHNNGNVQINYKDCIPTNVGGITFTSNASDVQYLTFNTSFRFATYEIV